MSRKEEKENPSWKTQAAAAGLKGMTLSDAVKRAMHDPTFQLLPDPILAVRTFIPSLKVEFEEMAGRQW